jgi:hypothetical protein
MRTTQRPKKKTPAARAREEKRSSLTLARHRYHLAFIRGKPRTDPTGPPASYFEHVVYEETKPTAAFCVRCNRKVWADVYPTGFGLGCDCFSARANCGQLLVDQFTTEHWTEAIGADQPIQSARDNFHALPLTRAGTIWGGSVNQSYWQRLERESAEAACSETDEAGHANVAQPAP